jgi:hypothetical protein
MPERRIAYDRVCVARELGLEGEALANPAAVEQRVKAYVRSAFEPSGGGGPTDANSVPPLG